MAVVAIPSQVERSQRGIRPLDPSRDLPTVVDLIAMGFKEELGPQGYKMLQQMRRLAHPPPLVRFLYQKGGTLPGFVWEENGAVVANLSLRRAAASQHKGWIIGNVVVHPDFRGRGIGRALMETAMDAARIRNGEWIGLEVRATNEIARTLYQRLNFYNVGRTAHMIHLGEDSWPTFPKPKQPWRAAKPDDRYRWAKLAACVYGHLQQKVLEIYPGRYSYGGLERRITFWLRGERERAWLEPTDSPRRAARVRTDYRNHFHLWDLLVHPQQKQQDVEETVSRAMTTLHPDQGWPVVTTVEAKSNTVLVLESLGFQHHRTLVQMSCNLR